MNKGTYKVDYYLKNKERILIANTKYAQENKDKRSIWEQKRALHTRKSLIELLGGGCEVCGDTNFKHLQFDHRATDGAQDRRENKRYSTYLKFKHWLETPDIKEKLACLCANCHAEKTFDTDGYAYGTRRHARLSQAEITVIIK